MIVSGIRLESRLRQQIICVTIKHLLVQNECTRASTELEMEGFPSLLLNLC